MGLNRTPTAILEARGSFIGHKNRKDARAGEPVVTKRLGSPPKTFTDDGGEGGLRTLGTGISQYNGLANLSFLGSLSRLNGLQSGWMHQNWLNKVSLGNFCSPLCSPVFGES